MVNSLVSVALVLVAFSYQFAQAQLCSLYDNNINGVNLFNYPSFSPTSAVNLTWTNIVGNVLRLAVDETNGGTVGYAWHSQAERIADGFTSTFTFQVNPKSLPGDGFVYFIQNDKTVDLNGGSGSKLGAFGIARSIGVRIDLCVDRPSPCATNQLSLQLTNGSLAQIPISGVTTAAITAAGGGIHTVTVTYEGRLYGPAARLRVGYDTNPSLIDVAVGDLSDPSFFNGRFAFFGFTASTSWTNTANIDILSWRTDLVPSDTKTDKFTDSITPLRVDFNTTLTILVTRLTPCGAAKGVNDGANVTSTLIQQPLTGQDPLDAIKMKGVVVNNGDGTYSITYFMPAGLQAVWDIDVQANGVSAQNMPFVGGVISQKPNPGGSTLPVWALVLLLLLILLIILVLSYIVYRLHRYRKKLQQNAEFIEAGKKQAELDRLEDGVSYSANKMVGTIDDLKAQLTKNEDELAKLRARGALGEDQNFTIEQLQKQRDALLEEMNRLKREEQEEELKRSKATQDFQSGGRAKKEFGREQI